MHVSNGAELRGNVIALHVVLVRELASFCRELLGLLRDPHGLRSFRDLVGLVLVGLVLVVLVRIIVLVLEVLARIIVVGIPGLALGRVFAFERLFVAVELVVFVVVFACHESS